ncbi:GDSL-type esterase/lipase family protein [Planctomyces sp. SH-PL14]|uniref:GDSL-type esterase/lipase family protein n=1 Tax=Planctomyces sp. SH-PL14 TaxID=1632864 RepID=UPI00078DDFA5|nr:GDSL-type esterase/lipase family protein [Planctomyces sp. SH-PL14]AMV21312.1 GDSL-like Lipase/Acylhydrolase [Planctomyces sp. SH-PL14]
MRRAFLTSLTLLLVTVPSFADDKPQAAAPAVENTAILPAPACEKDFYDWNERHAAVRKTIAETPPDLIFIGDSITHLWGGRPQPNRSSGQKVWDDYYAKRNAANLGFGWDRTQQVLWRLENGEFEGIAPKVAVVLIGTNNLTSHNVRENTDDEIVAGIRAVCETIQKKSPQTKILLLGLLPRGKDPKNPHRQRIQNINASLKESMEDQGGVTFLDIGPSFLIETGEFRPGLAPDHLHLSEEGYRVWAEAMEPTLVRLLGE